MKMNLFIPVLVGAIAIMLLIMLSQFVNAKTTVDGTDRQTSTRTRLTVKTDPNPQKTSMLADSVRTLTPLLRPERLRRRMKMLWGIDMNDYPDDKLIVLAIDVAAMGNNGDFRGDVSTFMFSPQYGTFIMQTYQDSYYEDRVPTSFPPEQYALFYRYLMMSDTDALRQYRDEYKESFADDFISTLDFVIGAYNSALFEARETTLEYYDQNSFMDMPLIDEGSMSNIRLDALHLYLEKERKKGRVMHFFGYEEPYFDIPDGAITLEYIDDMRRGGIFYHPIVDSDAERYISPISGGRAVASWLSAHLRYQDKSIDSMVVRCLYGTKDFARNVNNRDAFVANIESNNYFGYTILREFFENPLREMPTLEKIGTWFQAGVKENDTLLLLEPIADSYDIDTIQTSETFKAYEMGHDDYYFVEVVKPVESPVAGPDGYAMIFDRTEIVYGYIPKDQVEPIVVR
jgi:hypothetical protein